MTNKWPLPDDWGALPNQGQDLEGPQAMTREIHMGYLSEQMRADGNAKMLDEAEAEIKELRAEVERLTRLLDAFHDGVESANRDKQLAKLVGVYLECQSDENAEAMRLALEDPKP